MRPFKWSDEEDLRSTDSVNCHKIHPKLISHLCTTKKSGQLLIEVMIEIERRWMDHSCGL